MYYSILIYFILVLSVDAMDVSGEQQINLDHNIYKRRLDEHGKPLEKPEKESKYILLTYLYTFFFLV